MNFYLLYDQCNILTHIAFIRKRKTSQYINLVSIFELKKLETNITTK